MRRLVLGLARGATCSCANGFSLLRDPVSHPTSFPLVDTINPPSSLPCCSPKFNEPLHGSASFAFDLSECGSFQLAFQSPCSIATLAVLFLQHSAIRTLRSEDPERCLQDPLAYRDPVSDPAPNTPLFVFGGDPSVGVLDSLPDPPDLDPSSPLSDFIADGVFRIVGVEEGETSVSGDGEGNGVAVDVAGDESNGGGSNGSGSNGDGGFWDKLNKAWRVVVATGILGAIVKYFLDLRNERLSRPKYAAEIAIEHVQKKPPVEIQLGRVFPFLGVPDFVRMGREFLENVLTGEERAFVFLEGSNQIGKSNFIQILKREFHGKSVVIDFDFKGSDVSQRDRFCGALVESLGLSSWKGDMKSPIDLNAIVKMTIQKLTDEGKNVVVFVENVVGPDEFAPENKSFCQNLMDLFQKSSSLSVVFASSSDTSQLPKLQSRLYTTPNFSSRLVFFFFLLVSGFRSRMTIGKFPMTYREDVVEKMSRVNNCLSVDVANGIFDATGSYLGDFGCAVRELRLSSMSELDDSEKTIEALKHLSELRENAIDKALGGDDWLWEYLRHFVDNETVPWRLLRDFVEEMRETRSLELGAEYQRVLEKLERGNLIEKDGNCCRLRRPTLRLGVQWHFREEQ